MTTEPKVSIIVTVYNSGNYLSTCLDSLAAQTLHDIEFVIVNDGSPDPRDADIIRDFLADPRFVLVENDGNRGTGYSRSAGVAKATGEYIGFLDSDDYCEPYTYELMHLRAKRDVADIVVADYITTSRHNINLSGNMMPENPRVEVTTGEDLFSRQMNRLIAPFYLRVDWWNKIYRRTLFDAKDFSFPHIVRNEGTASMMMSLLADRVAIIDWQTFYTSVREERVSRKFHEKHIDDTISSARHFRKFLIARGSWKEHRALFESFFYFIIFNLNLKLISRLPEEEAWHFARLLRTRLMEDEELRLGFMEYVLHHDRLIEQDLFFFIPLGEGDTSRLRGIDATAFHPRCEGGRRVRRGTRVPSSRRPLVSVVTITMNLVSGGRINFFRKMADTVAAQDYGRENIEHIVIDGGSTDGTVDFLSELDRAGRIDYWLSERDSGIYGAMNKGHRYARGDYVIYMNSDDYFAPNAISTLLHAIKANRADYAFANAAKVDNHEKEVGKHSGNIDRVYFGTPYCHQTLLCHHRCFDHVIYDESFKVTMWSYALDLYLSGLKYTYVDETLAYFRVGGVSTATELVKFEAEQTRIIRDRIADPLGLSMEEYEYLNGSIRETGNTLYPVETNAILRKLAASSHPIAADFQAKLLAQLLVRRIAPRIARPHQGSVRAG